VRCRSFLVYELAWRLKMKALVAMLFLLAGCAASQEAIDYRAGMASVLISGALDDVELIENNLFKKESHIYADIVGNANKKILLLMSVSSDVGSLSVTDMNALCNVIRFYSEVPDVLIQDNIAKAVVGYLGEVRGQVFSAVKSNDIIKYRQDYCFR